MKSKVGQKRVLITGGASGIGLTLARRFARESYCACLFDLDHAAAERAALELGSSAIAVAGSVTEKADIDRAIGAMTSTFGGVDCVITSAGIVKVEPSFDVEPATFLKTLEVNV